MCILKQVTTCSLSPQPPGDRETRPAYSVPSTPPPMVNVWPSGTTCMGRPSELLMSTLAPTTSSVQLCLQSLVTKATNGSRLRWPFKYKSNTKYENQFCIEQKKNCFKDKKRMVLTSLIFLIIDCVWGNKRKWLPRRHFYWWHKTCPRIMCRSG